MKIKDRIRELRTNANMTQAQLGQQLGVSPDTIRSYEAGRREPNSKIMAALESYFDVSGAYLRGETNQMQWENQEISNAIDENLLIAANSLISTTRKGSEKTSSNIFAVLVELRSLINAEQKKNTDSNSDLTCQILIEAAKLSRKLLDNENNPDKWQQICADGSFNITMKIMDFYNELQQKKDIENN